MKLLQAYKGGYNGRPGWWLDHNVLPCFTASDGVDVAFGNTKTRCECHRVSVGQKNFTHLRFTEHRRTSIFSSECGRHNVQAISNRMASVLNDRCVFEVHRPIICLNSIDVINLCGRRPQAVKCRRDVRMHKVVATSWLVIQSDFYITLLMRLRLKNLTGKGAPSVLNAPNAAKITDFIEPFPCGNRSPFLLFVSHHSGPFRYPLYTGGVLKEMGE